MVISKHTVSAEVISISKLFLCTCSIKIGVCWSFPWGPPLYNFSWSRTLSIHPTFCIFSMSNSTVAECLSHVTLNSTSSFCLQELKSFFRGQCPHSPGSLMVWGCSHISFQPFTISGHIFIPPHPSITYSHESQ